VISVTRFPSLLATTTVSVNPDHQKTFEAAKEINISVGNLHDHESLPHHDESTTDTISSLATTTTNTIPTTSVGTKVIKNTLEQESIEKVFRHTWA
jgi:hypothetical protein